MKRHLALFLAVTVLACFAPVLSAQEKSAPQEKPAPAAADRKSPEMSPEEKAAMDKMIAAGTPGEPHKFIAQMEGRWRAVVKMWQAPGQEPGVSEGVSVNRMVMGGRYLQETFKSSFMDAPFEGMGVMGYDNVLKRFQGFWMDNMSTAIMTSEGELSPDGKTLNSVSTYSDPQTGKAKTSRDVTRIVSRDKFISETYDVGPDGKEFLMMEITYTREIRPTRDVARPPLKKLS